MKHDGGGRRQFVDDGLRRGEFTEERVAELAREYGDTAGMRINTEAERDANRNATLAAYPRNQDLWIFGYGSLMWNPAFHHAETRSARIYGYHRRFCLWTPMGRGTPERPGLTLGLQRGGSCHGLVLRIPSHQVDAETRFVWRREMLAGGYRAAWVRAHCNGQTVRAVTFVVDPKHHRYGGKVPLADTVQTIATAQGRLGRCRDYLHNLILHLDALGLTDGEMHHLYQLVESHSAQA